MQLPAVSLVSQKQGLAPDQGTQGGVYAEGC